MPRADETRKAAEEAVRSRQEADKAQKEQNEKSKDEQRIKGQSAAWEKYRDCLADIDKAAKDGKKEVWCGIYWFEKHSQKHREIQEAYDTALLYGVKEFLLKDGYSVREEPSFVEGDVESGRRDEIHINLVISW